MTNEGWHYATGDPVGTVRFWNGSQWVGEPVVPQVAPSQAPPFQSPHPPAYGAQAQPPETPSGPGGSSIAGVGRRLLGRAIDFVIGSTLFAVFIVSGVGGSEGYVSPNGNGYSFNIGQSALDSRVEYIVLGIFLLVYHALPTFLVGGTVGKLITGTRVADNVTGVVSVSFAKAALRSANYVTFLLAAIALPISTAMSLVTGLGGMASLVMLFADGQRRTVMDRIAKTVVINRK